MPAPAVNKGAALRLFERESMALRTLANLMIEASRFETMMAPAPESTPSTTDPCVDGPRLARDNFACRTEVACSHVSGLLVQSGWTAGPDGVREPSPHHSNGIDVPMKRQVWLDCVGSTDCAITRHCSLASSRTCLSGLSRRGHALVVLMPVHHRPGDARGLVG